MKSYSCSTTKIINYIKVKAIKMTEERYNIYRLSSNDGIISIGPTIDGPVELFVVI